MNDEQFDDFCRRSLDFDPGTASPSTWSKMRPKRWSWLPTVPEIFATGCACALALIAVGVRFNQTSDSGSGSNPVIQRAIVQSSAGLQASTIQIPDTTQWTTEAIRTPSPVWLVTGERAGGEGKAGYR